MRGWFVRRGCNFPRVDISEHAIPPSFRCRRSLSSSPNDGTQAVTRSLETPASEGVGKPGLFQGPLGKRVDTWLNTWRQPAWSANIGIAEPKVTVDRRLVLSITYY